MSPVRKPSAVESMRKAARAVEVVEASASTGNPNHGLDLPPAPQLPLRPPKPVRVTLDLDVALYEQLTQWAATAGSGAGLQRLPLSKALRAMIRVTLADKGIAAVVADQARRDSE